MLQHLLSIGLFSIGCWADCEQYNFCINVLGFVCRFQVAEVHQRVGGFESSPSSSLTRRRHRKKAQPVAS